MSGEISSYDGRGFCPRCGSRLLDTSDPGDTLIEIRIGSLDEAPFELKPEDEIWVKRRESWIPPVEGGWVDRVVGLEGVRVEYAMVETPDGRGRLELVKFHSPSVRGGDGHAPANILGIRHVAFVVDDIDAAVATVRARGGELVGEVENYEDVYRLCYVRGPEGIIVELAERIG